MDRQNDITCTYWSRCYLLLPLRGGLTAAVYTAISELTPNGSARTLTSGCVIVDTSELTAFSCGTTDIQDMNCCKSTTLAYFIILPSSIPNNTLFPLANTPQVIDIIPHALQGMWAVQLKFKLYVTRLRFY